MTRRGDGMQELKIRRFDMKNISHDATICVIGKRRTGKSFLVRDLMYHFRDIPKGLVISGSEHCNPWYQNFIPDSYIYPEYDPAVLKQVFANQEMLINRQGGKSQRNNFFMIMDDVLTDVNLWKKDRLIKKSLFEGRHYNLFMVIVLQYCMALAPEQRTNIDYIFIFRDNIKANRKRLYENFAGMVPSLQIFETLMDQCTEDHHCLVINNNSLSNKLEDILYFYKASPHSKFRVGSPKYWQLHDENYRPPQDKPEEKPLNPGVRQSIRDSDKNFRIVLRTNGGNQS